MAKNLSCVSHGSLKRFPHTFTTVRPLVVHDGLGSVEIKTFDQDTRKGCC